MRPPGSTPTIDGTGAESSLVEGDVPGDGHASDENSGTGTLPHPTGRFSVGRSGFEIIDPMRAEIYSENPADKRELVTWIWYPAAALSGSKPAAYMPVAWQPVDQLLGVDTAAGRCHAIDDPPLSGSLPSYPVLLFSPSGFPPLMWAAIAEELASHGYVVIGVNHTYETTVTAFADGRVMPANPAAIAGVLGPQQGPHDAAFSARGAVCDYKTADLRSVADWLASGGAGPRFETRLDLGRLGAFGHSFGGNAALEWCRSDVRCRASANLDGALWSEVGSNGLDRPALQVLADHHEFDLSPDDAVAAGMAPDRAWFIAEKSIAFGGWRTVDRTARPRLLRAGPRCHPRQLHGRPIPAAATQRADRGPAGGHVDRCRADVADRHPAAARLLRRNPRRPSQSGC